MSEPFSTAAAQAPGVLRRLLRNRTAVAAMIVLGVIVFVAIFGPYVFRYDPETVTPYPNHPPSWLPLHGEESRTMALKGPPVGTFQFPLGTDLNGRDLFSRIIQGARISLLVGLCGALVSFFVGTSYGLISGYIGGLVDN